MRRGRGLLWCQASISWKGLGCELLQHKQGWGCLQSTPRVRAPFTVSVICHAL